MKTAIKDDMHLVISCLLTHSRFAQIVNSDFTTINSFFNLSKLDLERLKSFFKLYGHKFFYSSVIMEEKRFKELLFSIPLVSKIISQEHLKLRWQLYLQNYSIKDPIPATPNQESIKFLNYLLNEFRSSDIKAAIIEYEMIRNKVFEIQNIAKPNSIKWLEVQLNIKELKIELNPSVTFKIFKYPISTIKKQINQNNFQFLSQNEIEKHEEIVIFWKNYKNENNCMLFNSLSLNLLLELRNYPRAYEWIECCKITTHISQDKLIGYLKTLERYNIIYLQKVEKNYV